MAEHNFNISLPSIQVRMTGPVMQLMATTRSTPQTAVYNPAAVKSVAAISAEDACYGEDSITNLYASPHNFVPDYETDDADMQLDDMAEAEDKTHVADGCSSRPPTFYANMVINGNGGFVENKSLFSACSCGYANLQDVQSDSLPLTNPASPMTTESPLTETTDPAADLAAEFPEDSGLYYFIEEEGIDAPILIIG